MERQSFAGQIKRWECGFALLYAVFFVAQILSPSVNNRTIYLEWFIMLINPYFWQWLLPIRFTYRKWLIVLLLLFMIVLGHPITALKIVLNIYSAMVLVYLWKKKLWYINKIIYISVLVAVLQLMFMGIDVTMAYMLGPENISSVIWGEYATQTNTNLYDAMGIGIPRAAGLSREAGFFASLLVVVMLHNVVEVRKSSNWGKFIYLLGYIASFSKMSIVIIVGFIVIKIKSFIDKIYMPLWVIFFLVFMLVYWSGESSWLNEDINRTFLSRFGGYDAMWYLEPSQLFWGESELDKVGGISAINEYYGENNFAGIGGWIIENGIILFAAFVLILWLLGLSSTGVVLLLLLTINVQPDTNQNFVVYAWFLCMHYFRQ